MQHVSGDLSFPLELSLSMWTHSIFLSCQITIDYVRNKALCTRVRTSNFLNLLALLIAGCNFSEGPPQKEKERKAKSTND